MFPRKIGKLLLGKSTPFHLYATCVIAGFVAFAPGFADAPALWVSLIALICVLPINLFLMSMLGLGLYPLSLVLQPVSFEMGRFLLDGPTQSLFVALINAPFTALMGFEYYVGSGGLFLGALLGLLCGWGITRVIRSLRNGVLKLDKNSTAFNKWAGRGWVKLFTWVLLGAKPDMALYEKLSTKKIGMPIRPLGVVVAAVVVGAALGLGHLLSGSVLTGAMQRGLEQANGATVDLEKVEFDLAAGKLVIDGLAIADKEDLTKDILRAARVDADISVESLLRRRIRIDKLVMRDASSGRTRATAGKIIGDAPEPKDVPIEEANEKTLEDYLEDARVWRERLQQLQRWLDALGGSEAEEIDDEEALEKRLERMVALLGYGGVIAEHLIEGAPRLVISELRAEGLQAMQMDGDPLDVLGENLSTHPRLIAGAPHFSVRKRDGSFVFDAKLAGLSAARGENRIDFVYKGLASDVIGQRLKTKPMSGGTIDVSTSGLWGANGVIDFKLDTIVRNAKWTLPGMSKPERIDVIELPIRVYGPSSDPRILFREKDLSAALKKAGKKELTKRATKEIDKQLGKLFGGGK